MHGPERSDFLLSDANLAALPEPSQAATADHLRILPDAERNRLAFNAFVRERRHWPPLHVLNQIPVRAAARPGHYARIVQRMLDAKMAVLRPPVSAVVENSVFGIWKTPGETMRFI